MQRKFFALALLLSLLLALPLAARAADAVLILPDAVEVVGEQAFYGNQSIRRVALSGNVREIGAEAFAASGLKEINLPDSVREIAPSAFDGLTGLAVYVQPDSQNGQWAADNGFEVRLMQAVVAQVDAVAEKTLVTLTAEALNLPESLSWQWQRSADGVNWTDLAGYDAAELRFMAGGKKCADQYRCAIASDFGVCYSNPVKVDMILNVTVTPATPIATMGQALTLTAAANDAQSWQWQSSADGVEWTDLAGQTAAALRLVADDENRRLRYRCSAVDSYGFQGVSAPVEIAVTGASSVLLNTYALGMQAGETAALAATVKPVGVWSAQVTWASSDESVATVSEDGVVTALRHGQASITATSFDGKVSAPCVVTVKTKYRALLVAIDDFYWSDINRGDHPKRNSGDVTRLNNMLASVSAPDGDSYAVTTKHNLTPATLQSAIRSAFAGADDDSVSLFSISTHGDSKSEGAYAGALWMYGESADNESDYVLLEELAGWLSEVKGKVIVILESCGTGAGIYSEGGVPKGPARQAADFDALVVDAFRRADPGVITSDGAVPKTGEFLKQNKFYVLTSSAAWEDCWGTEINDPRNYFVEWLAEGVGASGSMPADQQFAGNGDGRVDLHELYSYISGVGDNHPIPSGGKDHYQHVQVYPANTRYVMFR